MNWDDLETGLYEAPLFQVQKPDGQKHLSELARVVAWRNLMRLCAPACAITPFANAGKRSPTQARREGIIAGAFDYQIAWSVRGVAYIEFKGYTSAGKAGKLSQAQIDWGNAHFRMGHSVACFFTPERALEWLRDHGAPVVGRVVA